MREDPGSEVGRGVCTYTRNASKKLMKQKVQALHSVSFLAPLGIFLGPSSLRKFLSFTHFCHLSHGEKRKKRFCRGRKESLCV
ncbi:hypothetical protein CSUI_007518 [Cystoisospora suis]|uniref:Uncharacterized protein n=1 Tax=Cystoisospora suis TaxID=483139 RepID=A0A2C6KQA8_9APIC|nr:hypothetical protein CSUI_007518 [Cystoisospora suis]